jgi:hypothetical protein
MAAIIEVKYFNSFLLKKTIGSSNKLPLWNGSRGIPKVDQMQGGYSQVGTAYSATDNWLVIILLLI